MKFGSVTFFKRLIVSVFILIIAVPLVLAITFGVLYAGQKQRADRLETLTWALASGMAVPDEIQKDEDFSAFLQQMNPDKVDGITTASFPYQTRYPHLYATPTPVQPTEGKVCYLTFDDGPSANTAKVLDTLDDYNVKATFFVTGENTEKNADILLRASEEGHTIGVHTYSHDYTEIYASVDAFLDDFEKMHAKITEVTGTAPAVFRFAGGSINVYNRLVYADIAAEMLRRGFVFFDWNVAASDAVVGGITRQQVTQNVLGGVGDNDRIIVLMHDRLDNASTVAALPDIIAGLQKMGYRFEPLSAAVKPITYVYEG